MIGEYSGDHLSEVDVLFFDVGDTVYGTDASQVLRIDRSHPEDFVQPGLGPLRRGGRVLVFDTPEGEGHLKVDAIRGVQPIPLVQLRRMPPAAAAASYAIGVFLEADEAHPILLIDLVETLKAQGRH
ncbi:MAG TPA: Frizzy aggregation protein FrzB [Myxococcaceae bacterium]|nr:Frizzy aggregation protein FrzB [Myxococcaceae bacterium]